MNVGIYDIKGWTLSHIPGSSSAIHVLQEADAAAMLLGFTAIWVMVGTTLICPYPSSCDPHELSYAVSLTSIDSR